MTSNFNGAQHPCRWQWLSGGTLLCWKATTASEIMFVFMLFFLQIVNNREHLMLVKASKSEADTVTVTKIQHTVTMLMVTPRHACLSFRCMCLSSPICYRIKRLIHWKIHSGLNYQTWPSTNGPLDEQLPQYLYENWILHRHSQDVL